MRSAAVPCVYREKGRTDDKHSQASEKRERDFLTASIDQADYIDFRIFVPEPFKRHR